MDVNPSFGQIWVKSNKAPFDFDHISRGLISLTDFLRQLFWSHKNSKKSYRFSILSTDSSLTHTTQLSAADLRLLSAWTRDKILWFWWIFWNVDTLFKSNWDKVESRAQLANERGRQNALPKLWLNWPLSYSYNLFFVRWCLMSYVGACRTTYLSDIQLSACLLVNWAALHSGFYIWNIKIFSKKNHNLDQSKTIWIHFWKALAHGLTAEGIQEEVKRLVGPPTRSWGLNGP